MVYTYKKISIGLLQHVNYPTHIHGHWFNLFITRTSCDLVKTVYPSEDLSDHMTVVADVGVKLFFHASKKCFSYRRVKGLYHLQIFFQISISIDLTNQSNAF